MKAIYSVNRYRPTSMFLYTHIVINPPAYCIMCIIDHNDFYKHFSHRMLCFDCWDYIVIACTKSTISFFLLYDTCIVDQEAMLFQTDADTNIYTYI